MCPGCNQAVDQCQCDATADRSRGDGIVRVGRATKGRKGKGVTVITGLSMDAVELTALAKKMKSHCGAGGGVRDGAIEIQGDHRDALLPVLEAEGWTVKRAGG